MTQGVEWKDFAQFMEMNGREHTAVAGRVGGLEDRMKELGVKVDSNTKKLYWVVAVSAAGSIGGTTGLTQWLG